MIRCGPYILPDLPVDVEEYPYLILRNDTNSNLDLFCSKNIGFVTRVGYSYVTYKSSVSSESLVWYKINRSGALNRTASWTNAGTASYAFVDGRYNRNIEWANYDVPYGSASGTQIAYRKVPDNWTYGFATATNGTVSLTFMANAGDKVLGVAYTRGNSYAFSNTFTVLASTNPVSASGITDQRTHIITRTEPISQDGQYACTITNAGDRAALMVLILPNVASYQAIPSALYTNNAVTTSVTRPRPEFDNIIWAASRPFDGTGTGTNTYYWTQPNNTNVFYYRYYANNDVQDNARLMAMYDFGKEDTERIFKFSNAADETPIAIAAVAVIYDTSLTKYLVKDGEETVYTVVDDELVSLGTPTINAQLFRTYGADTIPTWSIIESLSDPSIMKWSSDEEASTEMRATMLASPFGQTLTTTPVDISMADGIQSCSVGYSGAPKIALKFDDGDWEYYDGSDWVEAGDADGMLPQTMLAISSQAWTDKFANHDLLTFRVIFDTINDKISIIRFKFAT